MDLAERERIDRINRNAEGEKTPDDPNAIDARDGKPLIVMVAAALAATALVLGMMWVSNSRYDGASARALAEQGE
jgi:hypothetical protein